MYDLALVNVGVVEERFNFIGFTRPYGIEAVRFVVHKGAPKPITPVLVEPFRADVRILRTSLINP